jgi:hypothetical protein
MKAISTGLLQFYDPNTGKPVANGFVATYDTVSTSPKETFSDVNGLVTNPNPVPLDATGSAYIFGEGSYTFVVKNQAGVNVRTIENIGVLAGGAYEIDGDTLTLSIGGGNNGYDSDDLLPIYSQSEPHELLGFGDMSEIVLQANVDNKTVSGDYETVSALYASSSAAIPSGALVFDGPQDGYDPVSTRLYEFKSDGNFSVDPQADANVDQSGVGDNYIDLFRKAATEEMRIKRTPMYWDVCKDLIGLQTIQYPIIVIGSNGKFYTTSGSPTAEQMATVDPVLDTTATVWAYVYDPTETAAYPPWYRSPNQGITYNSTVSIKACKQSCKLLDTSGDFTNDGKLIIDYYKSSSKWAFGSGTQPVYPSTVGTPIGGYVASSGASMPATAAWYNVWMIKTSGGDTDVAISGVAYSLVDVLGYLNNGSDWFGEVAAGRTWTHGRRIAYAYVDTGIFRSFNNTGDGNYTLLTAGSIGTGAAVNCSVYVPIGAAGYFYGLQDAGAEDTVSTLSIGEIGYATAGSAYAKAGSNFVDYNNSTGSVRLKPNSSGNISAVTSGGGAATVYCTAWQDLYED